MSNVLSFSLGLESGAWISALEGAGKELTGFLSIAEVGRFTIEKFSDAIKEGGAAFQESFASGVSTGHLVQLSEAFKAVGLDASQVETISFRLQNALTGVNDSGQRTELAFSKLGLQMRALRSLNPAQQILSVSDAFQKLDRNAQTGVASILFGSRGGAAPFLQLARQGEAFREAFNKAAKDAETFQKLSGEFAKIGRIVLEIESHLHAMFAELSGGFIVPLEKALRAIETIPWGKIATDGATAINALFGAFEQGKVGLLIGDSIKTGFEIGSYFIGPLFSRLITETENFGDFLTITLLKSFENVIVLFQTGMILAIEKAAEALGKIPGVGKALGIAGYKAESAGAIARSAQKGDDLGINALNSAMNTDIAKRRAQSNEDFGKAWNAALNGPLKDFAGRWKDLIKPPQINGPQSQDQAGGQTPLLQPRLGAASQYEKIGLILNTVAGMSGDHAKRTADNTSKMISQLNALLEIITGARGLVSNPYNPA